MSNAALDYSAVPANRSFRRAEVVALDPGATRLRVSPLGGTDGEAVWAEVAVPAGGDVALGQHVLVAEAEGGEHYVCGVLEGTPGSTLRLTAKSGASAELGDDRETLRVRSPTGELVFEYDPVARRTVLCVPDGDLEISAPEGTIGLVSGKDLHLRGAGSVEVSGGERVGVGVGSGAEPLEPMVELGRSLLRLCAPVLRLQAQRGEAITGVMNLRGETLSARWGSAKVTADRLETWALDVVSRARDVRQTVDRLWQVKSERIRAAARGACRIQAGRLDLRAEEDVKVRGDRIELG